MKCLKCGRETEQTFCEACRADMEKYPVKPGTIVLLPKERPSVRKFQPRHPQVEPEEKVRIQRHTIRRLGRAVAILTVLLLLAVGAIIRILTSPTTRPVGQNYSTVTKPSEETTAPATEASIDSTVPSEPEE